MGDAEIIPIGTRGRPGRGSGRSNPSEASRNLTGQQPPANDVNDVNGVDDLNDMVSPPTNEPSDVERDHRPSADFAAQVNARLNPAGSPEPAAEYSITVPELRDVSDAPGPLAATYALPHHEAPEQRRGLPIPDVMNALTQAAKEVFGEDADRRLAELLAFLRRRITGDYEVDEYGLDPDLIDRFLMSAIRPLAQNWFRVEVRGVENLPTHSGALLVGNHSGTIPIDGLITMFAVHQQTGRYLRPLGADLIFRLPFVSDLARKAGATLACNEDAVRMLSGGELVAVWPEGFKGIGKPFADRYKLQRFGRGGFVSAAVKTGKPIIPVSIVGAEEIYPLIANIPPLARLLGVPYVPITPFFPLLGPLGLIPLPSKWIIEFGEPIETDHLDAAQADDPMLNFDVTDQVRETIQQSLYQLLMQRKSVFH